MVTLNRIYTRTGDAGTTALGSGERVAKFELRIEAYGTVDEANAAIGVAKVLLDDLKRFAGDPQRATDARLCIAGDQLCTVCDMLNRIQNDLFDLGADLCVPEREGAPAPKHERLRIVASQTERLEKEIDLLNANLAPLKSFVLPGGTLAAAQLHVARTVCRRAERLMCELAAEPGETVSPEALKYVNRLSDFLFVASRYVNDGGKGDVLWTPGQNR